MKIPALASRVVVSACLVSLGGCSIWPIEPQYDRNKLKAAGAMSPPVDVDDAKKIAAAWSATLQEATRDRRVEGIVASEVLFYGTLLFTAGSAQLLRGGAEHWRQVRNIGIAGAAGSQLFSSHYQPGDQALAFRKASVRMDCMIEALQPIPDQAEYLALFDDTTRAAINARLTQEPKDIDALYNAVPGQTLHFMEQVVLPGLQAELQAIRLGTPSKDELADLVDKYKASRSSGDAGAAGAGTPDAGTLSRLRSVAGRPAAAPAPTAEGAALRRKQVVSALSAYASAVALCRAG